MPQQTNSAAGSAASASTWAASLPGSHSSSSSQNATSSPSAARVPLLRAPANPGVRALRITRTARAGPLASSVSDSSGADWSNTTTTSIGPG